MPNKISNKKISLKNLKSKKTELKINKNSLDFLKSGKIYSLLVSSAIVVIYTSSMIYYLNKLKNCECYELKNKSNYSNLTFLITIEAIILTVNLLMFIMGLFIISTINSIKSGGGSNNNDMIPFYISLIITLVVSAYFIYYVYKLSENVDEDCKCTQNPLRYLLYIQALITLIYIIILLFNLFV